MSPSHLAKGANEFMRTAEVPSSRLPRYSGGQNFSLKANTDWALSETKVTCGRPFISSMIYIPDHVPGGLRFGLTFSLVG